MTRRGLLFALGGVAGNKTPHCFFAVLVRLLTMSTMMMMMISPKQCLSLSVRYGAKKIAVPQQNNSLLLRTVRATHLASRSIGSSPLLSPGHLRAATDPSSSHSSFASATENQAPKNSKKGRSKGSGSSAKTYRADRVLANRGWASRSECFRALKAKRVFIKKQSSGKDGDNNGDDDDNMIRVMGPSEQIPMDASLWVDGKTEVPAPPPLLRVYHKPKWVLSVMADPHGRPNLESLDDVHLSRQMHPVGRLDYDTSGLLLFSSEGRLTQSLLHPNHEIEKEYVATVVGEVDVESLRQKLEQGVTTSMGAFPAQLVDAHTIDDDDVAPIIADILDNLPPEYDLSKLEEKGHLSFKDAKYLSQVRLVVEEGKHRMVRRILANCGHAVIRLKRERLGIIHLGEMEEGQHRDLTEDESTWARSLLKNKKKKPPPSRKKPEENKRNKKG